MKRSFKGAYDTPKTVSDSQPDTSGRGIIPERRACTNLVAYVLQPMYIGMIRLVGESVVMELAHRQGF